MQAETKPLRILMVEDDLADATLNRRLLSTAPFAIDAVAHVDHMASALTCLGAEPFDVVLLDLSLPDSRGLDTLRRQFPDPSVIVTTGTCDEQVGGEAIGQGADDYLVKPFGQEKLKRLLGRYLVSTETGHGSGGSDQTERTEITGNRPSAESGTAPVDWEEFHHIYGRDDVVRDMMDTFLEEAPPTLAKLAAAVTSRSCAEVRMWAHKLKGAALVIAANPVASQAYLLEDAAENENSDLFQTILTELNTAFQCLLTYLSHHDKTDRNETPETAYCGPVPSTERPQTMNRENES